MKKPELTLFVAMLAAGLFGTSSAIARQQSAAAAPIGLNVTTVTQQAKTRAVTGNVVDSNGEPVIGATVSAVGAAVKTITDIDGNFRLSLPENVTRISVSYVGFATETVNVSGRNVVNVRLAEDINSLDQVVVVGYNLVKRSQITGSIQELSGKKIESNTSSSLEDRMQGRVPGLLISTGSSQPGSNDVKIRIRGTGSINGSNTPLYILDGNEIEAAQFASLNANDIADIQVLKDASSTAIYGSRGANGVIVITTKQGAAGRVQVSYSTKMSLSMLRDPKSRMMTGPENILYQTYCAEANPDSKAFPLMYLLALEAKEKNGTLTPTEMATLTSGRDRLTKARATDTDWMDEMTHDAFSMEHSVSLSGGNDRTKFYISGSYLDQQGALRGSEMERYNTRINVSTKINRVFDMGVNLSIGYSDTHTSDPSTGEGRYSWQNPWFTSLLAYPYESPEDWIQGDNPTLILKYFNRETQLYRMVGTAFLNARITDWLRFKTSFGLDYYNRKGMTSLDRDHPKAVNNHGYLSQRTSDTRYYTWTNTLNMNRTFAGKHMVSGVIGMEMYDRIYSGFNQTGYDLDQFMTNSPAGIGDKTGSSEFKPTIDGSKTHNNLLSYFTQWAYTYDHRYDLSASLRYDESSKFVGSNKHAMFWSIGAGWNMENEEFLKDINWINQLKVRASMGTNGNQDGIGDFVTFTGYGKKSYNGNPGYVRIEAGNPDLKWETSRQFDFGVDFKGFDNRVSLSLDYYNKTTKDLLMFKKISQISGFSQIPTNAGSIANRGVELSFAVTPIKSDFVWTIGGNISYNKNKITDLGVWANAENKFVDGDNLYEVGKALGTWYMVEWAGVNPDDGEVQFYKADGTKTEKIDEAPLVDKFKSYEIPWFGGFFTNLSYKGFELSANFSYAFDYYIMNSARWYVDNHAFNGNKPAYMLTMWRKPGDVTNIARFDAQNNPSPWASQFLENASYLKLKTLRLGYTLPQSLLNKIKLVRSAQVYLQGENLLTITDYSGMEPETSSGTDAMIYPSPRVFTFGLNINF